MPIERTAPIASERRAEQGFMLVGLIVTIFIILLVLGVAAPRLAKSLRRDRELEAVHRGRQYTRAIQLYYRKVGHYPGSIDQLEKTNNIRFLRQRYADPLSQPVDGKSEWRLIHVGEAKTTVKGFFGQPLAGISGGNGLGSAAGMASSGPAGAGAAGTGTTGSPNGTAASTSSFGSSSFGSSGTGAGSSGSAFGGSSTFGSSAGSSTGSSTGAPTGSAAGSQTGSSFGSVAGGTGTGTGTGSSNGISSQSATSFTGTGAPIIGVGSNASGSSIIVLNEQSTYPTWEFLYDPRVEQLKAKAALLGGPASTGTSAFGSSATSPGLNGAAAPGANSPSIFGASPTQSQNPGTPVTPPPAAPPPQ